MSPDLFPLVFMVAIITVACTLLGGLYLAFRHEPTPDKKTSNRIVVSNVK
jgi:hypothetical protein